MEAPQADRPRASARAAGTAARRRGERIGEVLFRRGWTGFRETGAGIDLAVFHRVVVLSAEALTLPKVGTRSDGAARRR
ncbi:hypothetical protein NUM3379_40610 [Kineococcus sp. NUM-3379]